MLAEQLFDGECEALSRKAVEMALEGNPTLMRLCLDRVLAPRKRRGVAFDLPSIRNAGDLAPAMTAIAEAAAQGLLSAGEAVEMAHVVESCMRAIEAGDLERRLTRLEAANGMSRDGD